MQQNQPDVNEIKRAICLALNLDPENPPVSVIDKDAAKALEIKVGTLSVWRSIGRNNLPYLKIGRLVRYRIDDLAVFIARRTYNHTGEI